MREIVPARDLGDLDERLGLVGLVPKGSPIPIPCPDRASGGNAPFGSETDGSRSAEKLNRAANPTATAERPRPRVGKQPDFGRRRAVIQYRWGELHDLIAWIQSDGLSRTDDQLLDEMLQSLGYQRRGSAIVSWLRTAIRTYPGAKTI
jgi:hypothetical protein